MTSMGILSRTNRTEAIYVLEKLAQTKLVVQAISRCTDFCCYDDLKLTYVSQFQHRLFR